MPKLAHKTGSFNVRFNVRWGQSFNSQGFSDDPLDMGDYIIGSWDINGGNLHSSKPTRNFDDNKNKQLNCLR